MLMNQEIVQVKHYFHAYLTELPHYESNKTLFFLPDQTYNIWSCTLTHC